MPRAARNPEATQFGFAHVGDAGEKTQRVGHVFQRVAPRYDVMNDVMSGGWHRVWKNIFVDVVAPRAGENVLDVAGGTGDIAKRLLKKTGGAINLTLADLSPEMLSVGKRRMADAGYWNKVTWVQADAAALPFDDACFDVITIAFGLRNVTRIDDALAEFYRCLRTGGRFFCMEFSPQVAAPLAKPYALYRDHIIPRLGAVVAHDRAAYQYLAESIQKFPAPHALGARLQAAGFAHTRADPLMGGVVYIHRAWKG